MRIARVPSPTAGRWLGEVRKSELPHSEGPLDFDDSATASRNATNRLPVPLPTVPFPNQEFRQLADLPLPSGGEPSAAAIEGRTCQSGPRLGWVNGILALTAALLVALLPLLIGPTSDQVEGMDVSVRSPLIEATPRAPRVPRIENHGAIPTLDEDRSAEPVGSPATRFVDFLRPDQQSPIWLRKG